MLTNQLNKHRLKKTQLQIMLEQEIMIPGTFMTYVEGKEESLQHELCSRRIPVGSEFKGLVGRLI